MFSLSGSSKRGGDGGMGRLAMLMALQSVMNGEGDTGHTPFALSWKDTPTLDMLIAQIKKDLTTDVPDGAKPVAALGVAVFVGAMLNERLAEHGLRVRGTNEDDSILSIGLVKKPATEAEKKDEKEASTESDDDMVAE